MTNHTLELRHSLAVLTTATAPAAVLAWVSDTWIITPPTSFDGAVNLVIADVMMPEMGGSELARRLAVERPGLPILFLSGYTDDEMTLRGLGPPSALVQKPFTPDVLARRVRELLG